MANALNDIATLDFGNDYWLMYLRDKIAQNGDFNTHDIDHAFTELFNTKIPVKAATPTLPTAASSKKQALFKLHKNKNVAGLFDDRELIFSPVITVIYGQNGTGKTTFYNVLKDAFHSNQNIKQNIYKTSIDIPKAEILLTDLEHYKKYQRKGIAYDHTADTIISWQKSLTNSKSSIKFCDDKILKASLRQKESSWDVDKFKLNSFERFQEAINQVEQKINSKIKELEIERNIQVAMIAKILSPNHAIVKPHFAEWQTYFGISLPIDFESQKLQYEKDKVVTFADLNTNKQVLENENNEIQKMQPYLEKFLLKLNQKDTLNNAIQKINEIKAKRDFSKFEQFNLLFNPNDAQNQDKFLDLIKKIAETALSYKKENYPNDIEKCFYCNQDLEGDSKNVITAIHSLIENEFKTELQSNERILQQICNDKLNSIEISESFSNYFQENSINTEEVFDNGIDNYYKNKIETLSDIDLDFMQMIAKIQKIQTYLAKKAKTNKDVIEDLKTKIDSIEKIKSNAKTELEKLNDTEIICNNQSIIKKIIDLNSEIQKYISKKDLQGTRTKITKKLRESEESLITDAFQVKFQDYLSEFKFEYKDKISRPISVAYGKSTIHAHLQGAVSTHQTEEILSEGEAKVHALCDWLAELDFNETTTLVFDDPITSLDDRHIEQFIKILCKLIPYYQIVVFTHNQQFYHKLVNKTLGTKVINSTKCQVCTTLEVQYQCEGGNKKDGNIYKCGNFYTIDYSIQAGILNDELLNARFSYQQAIETIRQDLLLGKKGNIPTEFRKVISMFFEVYVLDDIRRDVFKDSDLIHNWKNFKKIDPNDYDNLLSLHNKLSNKELHPTSVETNTNLDIRSLTAMFNQFITIVNKTTKQKILLIQ